MLRQMLLGLVICGFPQQGQSDEMEDILRLMENRFQALALIDSSWAVIKEWLPVVFACEMGTNLKLAQSSDERYWEGWLT